MLDQTLQLKHVILYLPVVVYFRHRGEFFRLVDEGKTDWESDEHRDLLRSMLMTASDISAITKPWDVQKRVRLVPLL